VERQKPLRVRLDAGQAGRLPDTPVRLAVTARTIGGSVIFSQNPGCPMRIRRGVVLAVIVLSTLSAAACGETTLPPASPSTDHPGSPTLAAAPLPTKEELAKTYLAAGVAYNDVWFKYKPILESETMTLAQGQSAGSGMATANWTLIEAMRSIRKSVQAPPGGYPTDAEFYKDVNDTLGEVIELALTMHGLWTRVRDATTPTEFKAAWEDSTYRDDGVVKRRMRSLLGLPDLPAG
jgi:hypothetical protein